MSHYIALHYIYIATRCNMFTQHNLVKLFCLKLFHKWEKYDIIKVCITITNNILML